ncbi:hypothetical protein [Lactobacillus crispatus]|uniref:hypothetical protein n=1 Tax=Lactobacillus crispatus TaxID=47770 RepID=UPI0014306ACF|nr:hypothetical protein [Lactobacillus crispatus]NJJ53428.1 hypothetical protein [Lactobacillus crispatus]
MNQKDEFKKYKKRVANAKYYQKTVGTDQGLTNERNKRKSKAKNFILKEANYDELKMLERAIRKRFSILKS